MNLSVNENEKQKILHCQISCKILLGKTLETEAILIPVTNLCMTALSLLAGYKSAYAKSSLAEIIGHVKAYLLDLFSP